MLVMHWLMVPVIVSQWVEIWWVAFIFAFVQVFTLWTLNLIAVELENPFGSDPNDIDSEQMQLTMNTHLRMLMSVSTCNTPQLKSDDFVALTTSVVEPIGDETGSFQIAWSKIQANSHPPSRRISTVRKKLAGKETRQGGSANTVSSGRPRSVVVHQDTMDSIPYKVAATISVNKQKSGDADRDLSGSPRNSVTELGASPDTCMVESSTSGKAGDSQLLKKVTNRLNDFEAQVTSQLQVMSQPAL